MSVSHHDLAHEFPEFKEIIQKLKTSDAHFRKLCLRYEELDKEIVRVESRIESRSDMDEEAMKKERLHVKSSIYSILVAAKC